MNGKRHATLKKGEIYKNKGGGTFLCLSEDGEKDPWLKNTSSGWTLQAHVITMYEDGTIEWDSSTGGHFPF